MNKYIFIITLLFKINVSFAHISSDSINNNNIVYDVVKTSLSFDSLGRIIPGGYYIYIEFTEKQWDIIKKYSYNDWICLLKNDETDWAANVILYYMYDKNAISLLRTNREMWIKDKKQTDIQFWEVYLKEQKLPFDNR